MKPITVRLFTDQGTWLQDEPMWTFPSLVVPRVGELITPPGWKESGAMMRWIVAEVHYNCFLKPSENLDSVDIRIKQT